MKQTGHYFEFKRGQWVKDGDKPAVHHIDSGHYVGNLTHEQLDELDAFIERYLRSIKEPQP